MKKIVTLLVIMSALFIVEVNAGGAAGPAAPVNLNTYTGTSTYNHSHYTGNTAYYAPSSRPHNASQPVHGYAAHNSHRTHNRCHRVYFWDKYGFFRSTVSC